MIHSAGWSISPGFESIQIEPLAEWIHDSCVLVCFIFVQFHPLVSCTLHSLSSALINAQGH